MSESPPKSAVATLAERLARAVVARPLLTLGLVLVVLAGSAWLARGLEVDTALSALLPETRDELERRSSEAYATFPADAEIRRLRVTGATPDVLLAEAA